MNLMIVEDEIRLLNSMANNIPWENIGVDVVALATDGAEALSLYEKMKPDIIIMDIVMPEMDGLSLSKTILSKKPDIRIIILSGHDDFQFAQAAVELGVFKYLLKPTGDEEIIRAVAEAAESVRSRLEARHNMEILQKRWVEHLPRLRDDFFRNWINGKYSAAELDRRSLELAIPRIRQRHFCAAVAEIDPPPVGQDRFRPSDIPLLQFSLHSIASEYLGEENCYVFQDHSGATVLVFYASEPEHPVDVMQRANQSAINLIGIFKECLKVTASAGIGLPCGAESVPSSYNQARKALQERVILGHEIVIPYQEREAAPHQVGFGHDFEKRLQIAVETGEREETVRLIRSLVGSQMESLDSLRAFQEFFLYLQSLIVRSIHSQGWSVAQVLGDDFAAFQSPYAIRTKEQLIQWVNEALNNMMTYAELERNSRTHRLIGAILTLIEESADQDITLHTVADRLYVNSSYLSRLFKKETGKPFSEYVLEHKMKKAKELLQQGEKVSEAARMTGYRDTSYFIKLFRKFWGVTPGELKR